MMDNEEIANQIQQILQSRKYRDLGIPETTLKELFIQEASHHKNSRDVVKAVRQKFHNIMAPYLGDPDYSQMARMLDQAVLDGIDQTRAVCKQILEAHASTRERLTIMEEFYPRLFEVTGIPQTILDLACGLHPFGLPWMGLPVSTAYYAYDIHQPRIDLINHFFALQGMRPLGFLRDILISPPEVEADAAFIFKEAHRMEQRQRGCSRKLWQALRVNWLLISLPTASLSGKHDLVQRQRDLVYGALDGLTWKVTEILFENEMVFCILKNAGPQ